MRFNFFCQTFQKGCLSFPYLTKIMRLIVVLILFFNLNSIANSLAQNVTLSVKKGSFQKVFKELSRQTGVSILYEEGLLKRMPRIDLDVTNMPLQQVMEQCLKNVPLSFSLEEGQLLIKEKINPIIEKSALVSADTTISGIVSDALGTPLSGASVAVKGIRRGTTTDATGAFKIAIPRSGVTLIISYIGYDNNEVKVVDNKNLHITLAQKLTAVDEVVVIGYGAVRRKTVTGSVSTVKMDNVNTTASTNFAQAIAGKAPGITAIQTSGQPGASISLQIRSNPSYASPGALYVVDGVIINDNAGEASSSTRYGSSGIDRSPLNFLNPNDIESIDFLKDASATSIYGARAGAGVVLITTKKGKGDKPLVQYDFSHSFQEALKFYDILGTKDYMQQRNKIKLEKWMFDNKIAPYGNTDPGSVPAFIPKYTQDQIDQQQVMPSAVDAITRKGFTQQHNLSVSGGSGKTRYYFSGNYMAQEGVLRHSDYNRYNGRINIDQGIGNKIRVGVNVILSGSKANNANIGTSQNEYSGMVLSAFYYPPTMPFKDSAGNYPVNPDYQNSPNPLSFLEITDYTKNNRTLTSGYAEWNIIEGLTAKASYSYDQSSSKRYAYLPKSFLYGARAGGQASIDETNATSNLQEYTLTYTKRFKEKHSLNLLAGHSYQVSNWDGLNLANDHFMTDNFLFYNMGLGTAPRPTVGSYQNPTRIWKSWFGRVIYDFDGKYILSASIRRDGASNFAVNKKWGTFPGISAAWILSEENFLKSIPVINFLKLRAGFGTTGNSNIGSSAFAYYSSNSSYVFGTTMYPGVSLSQLNNDNLTWETQKDINVGLDFQLLRNRISGSFDYFVRTISDLLSSIPLTTDFPVSSVAFNAGKTRSRGWDLGIQTKNIVSNSKDGFTWNTTINLSHYYNTWVQRAPAALKTLPKYIDPQGPFNGIFGYVSDGIYDGTKAAPAWMPGILPGGIIIKDLNGYDANGNLTGKPDGQISSADQQLLGINGARYSFGFGNTFGYKNFDLSIQTYGFIQPKYNSDYANAFSTYAQLGQFGWNVLSIAKDRWSYDNTKAKYPTGLPDPFATYTSNSDYWLENGNFLRVRDITLGYRLRDELVSKQKIIRSLRVFVSAQNPFIITKYKGIDPELQNFLAYPMTKSITIGLNAGF